ncbi:MAG: peptidyl-prolyl cis-trans isomerase [Spongiibacteraceae bacterium]|nr:peptidyl-prolyl cis-trans isomerase [Spongiibacteraceae bacterium]MBN4055132.1 peptidyl-prolyl cis-trans isomerase [bacterium AH-315-K03]
MKAFFREPLVYFLLIGGVIFSLSSFFEQSYENSQEIVVDRSSLLLYIQQKTKAIDQALLVRSFEAMPDTKRQEWINAYVREQALYREGQALGLEVNDPLIKGRVIQKLEFITKEYSEAVLKVSDAQLEQYFDKHKEDYNIEPIVTFTHVFFNRESHGDEKARVLALEKLNTLNKNSVPFSEGVQHGDRFPFHVNYVERTPEFITSHFGKTMSKEVFDFSITEETWRGPYVSPYGSHLILVSRLEQGRQPDLSEVVSQVFQDAQREQVSMGLEKAYQSIVDTYTVKHSDDLKRKRQESKLSLAGAQGR